MNLVRFSLVFSDTIMYNRYRKGDYDAIRYKIEILPALKAIGYTQTRIREDKLMGQATLQQLRHGELASWKTIDTVCRLLDCQPGDLLEHVPTEDTAGE